MLSALVRTIVHNSRYKLTRQLLFINLRRAKAWRNFLELMWSVFRAKVVIGFKRWHFIECSRKRGDLLGSMKKATSKVEEAQTKVNETKASAKDAVSSPEQAALGLVKLS